MKRMKELEDRRLKKMYAEERLKLEIAEEAIEKKGSKAVSTSLIPTVAMGGGENTTLGIFA